MPEPTPLQKKLNENSTFIDFITNQKFLYKCRLNNQENAKQWQIINQDKQNSKIISGNLQKKQHLIRENIEVQCLDKHWSAMFRLRNSLWKGPQKVRKFVNSAKHFNLINILHYGQIRSTTCFTKSILVEKRRKTQTLLDEKNNTRNRLKHFSRN